jgi:DNA-binding MarR family transcriptional regulator
LFVYEGNETMAPIPSNIPDCTIFMLAKAYQKAHGRFKALLKPYDLTNLQHLVLEGLWYRQETTAAELGKLLVLDKATLSGVLDRMHDSGWIMKARDPDDGRVFRITTTPKAEALKKELIDLRIKANEELLAGFTPDEKVLFKRLLKDLT